MSLLTEVLNDLEISYDDAKLEMVNDLYRLLVEKNRVMNLTSITEYDDFIIRHVADSLLVTKCISFHHERVIDVGTGAGFPGIPLKIFFPDIDIVLLDSLKKRLVFINEVIDALGLKYISTVHGRAEDLARDKSYRESFDLGVSRAVASLNVLSELTLPFIKKGGRFIYYKSSDIDEELSMSLNSFKILGGSVPSVFDVPLDRDTMRKFVVVDKINSTPGKYPRKAGTPSKDPLH